MQWNQSCARRIGKNQQIWLFVYGEWKICLATRKLFCAVCDKYLCHMVKCWDSRWIIFLFVWWPTWHLLICECRTTKIFAHLFVNFQNPIGFIHVLHFFHSHFTLLGVSVHWSSEKHNWGFNFKSHNWLNETKLLLTIFDAT